MIHPNNPSAKPRSGPPTVSVIMPVKNSARFLAEALSSLREQTCRDFEIIVIDGRSSDDTAAVVRDSVGRDDRPLRYLIQAGDGLADARNTGIEAARGRLIAFLDGDDRWDPAKLELQVERLSADPSLQYCLGWVRFFLESGTRPRPGFSPDMFERGQTGLTPGALLARRELFHTLGGFDPALAIGCDSDWFARASDRKIQMAVVPEALLLKRIHGENLSARTDLYRREMLTVLRQAVLRKRRSGRNDVDA